MPTECICLKLNRRNLSPSIPNWGRLLRQEKCFLKTIRQKHSFYLTLNVLFFQPSGFVLHGASFCLLLHIWQQGRVIVIYTAVSFLSDSQPNAIPNISVTNLGFVKTEEMHDHQCYCHSEVNTGQGRKLSNVLRAAEYS